MSHSFMPGYAAVAPNLPPPEDPAWHTVPRDAYQEALPETEWKVDHDQPGSVYVELGGSESAILPSKPYAVEADWERNTQQELLAVVTAGREKLAIVGVSELPKRDNPHPQKRVTTIRMDPGNGNGSLFGAEVVGTDEKAALAVGRSLLNKLGFKGPSDQMSSHHFMVEQRSVRNEDRVVITDSGSTNGTRVSVANAADYDEHQLKRVWGSVREWALSPEVAKDMRPSKMRPVPAESKEDTQRTPQGVRLNAQQGHTSFETRLGDHWPIRSRRAMRSDSGLDASIIAIARLGQDQAGSETLYVLDRGRVPYGEEWSLFEGGPLLSHSERRVIVDGRFLAAAQRARKEGDPRILHDFVSQRGGMVILDERQSSSIQLGRANWDWHFGREAGDQLAQNKTVSDRHAELRFIGGVGDSFVATDLRTTNGTDVYVGEQKSAK